MLLKHIIIYITAQIWDVPRKYVLLEFDDGFRYGLNATSEWSTLIPGEGIVHLGPQGTPHMISMFHELRCLDIIRSQIITPAAHRDLHLAQHCMNYIRQMVLCRGDTYLDPYQYPSHIATVDKFVGRKCLDWRAVYDAVESNQKEQERHTDAGKVLERMSVSISEDVGTVGRVDVAH